MARVNEFSNLAEIAQIMDIQNVLKGKRICITGHLGRPRKEIESIIKMAGGEVHTGVKYNTTHLLTNQDWTAGTVEGKSSKFRDAKRYHVAIISEKTFFDWICSSENG